MKAFQSTLPVGGATNTMGWEQANTIISIHAPRGGSDLESEPGRWSPCEFQSTLPVGGATFPVLDGSLIALLFQSTLPVGGATDEEHGHGAFSCKDFNPRSPWGERR